MRLPMTAAVAAVAVLASLATLPAAWAADGEANKKLVRSLIEEVMNKRQPAAVDRFLATDFIEHNPNLPQGRDGRKQFVAAVLAGFSDYRGEIVEILAEGDKVVVRTQWSGTQDGPFLGLPPSATRCASRPPISSASRAARWPSIGTWSTACRAPWRWAWCRRPRCRPRSCRRRRRKRAARST